MTRISHMTEPEGSQGNVVFHLRATGPARPHLFSVVKKRRENEHYAPVADSAREAETQVQVQVKVVKA